MTEEELLHTLALAQVPGMGLTSSLRLLKACGSAVDIFHHCKELPALVDGSAKLVEALHCPKAFERAKQELEFIHKNNIACYGFNDAEYPSRLRECEDAPLVLFFKGNASLNRLKVINMVGTRHATEYGKGLCHAFLRDLQQLCPDVLVVSGLAYGIDVNAHRSALEFGFDTVGVLAHGLDRLYPAAHRQTAGSMLQQGGLLTEFMSETNPEKGFFVQRNRVVAGMCDATIVVESAAKGGSLITADMAVGYNRDCFAFPGRCNDLYSKGCNNLIRDNRAALIQSAEDFVNAMRWNSSDAKPQPIQRALFPELTDEERLLVMLMQPEHDGMPLDELSLASHLPVNKLSTLLFELELKGVVKAIPGNLYKLLF